MAKDRGSVRLSRRKVLGSMGAIGAAGALGGAGTMAFYNDPENFEKNVFQAGEMDLKVDWQESYNGKKIEALPDTDDDGKQDPKTPTKRKYLGDMPEALDSDLRTKKYKGEPLINLLDVKPGDWGEVTFSLHVFGNPAWVWMNAQLRGAWENGTPEPERKDPDEKKKVVELLDEIVVVVWIDDDCDNKFDQKKERELFRGTLREFLTDFSKNYPKSVIIDGDTGKSSTQPFPNSHTKCVGLKWKLPVDHANEIMTDRVAFDVGFKAEQARHNGINNGGT